MPYDNDFFHRYEAYLEEPIVRRNHDRAFELFYTIAGRNRHVVDLGCGVGEFHDHAYYSTYWGMDLEPRVVGFDLNNVSKIERDWTCIEKRDWRQFRFFEWHDTLVSIFSVECMVPQHEAYMYYNQWFADNRALMYGIVSGFYYSGQRRQVSVSETGGITSYQTNSNIEDFKILNGNVEETRLVMPTPSEMFGPDVVEVWKIFRRKTYEEIA